MVIVFGLGFTGVRLARRLLERRVSVFAAVRGMERFGDLTNSDLQLVELNLSESNQSESNRSPAAQLPCGAAIALLIPPLPEPENRALRENIENLAPARVVYVSSTGVYGPQTDIDAATLIEPDDARGWARAGEEQWIASGPWSSLILRAAAIYGPGRGVHTALRAGRTPRGSASEIVSRIHVDDLAAIVNAGLFSDVQGAFPVADDHPCPSSEIVRWCIGVAGPAGPISPEQAIVPSARGRRVDGREIRRLLGVELKYPSWQTGVPASLPDQGM